jgi:hypothetical protein
MPRGWRLVTTKWTCGEAARRAATSSAHGAGAASHPSSTRRTFRRSRWATNALTDCCCRPRAAHARTTGDAGSLRPVRSTTKTPSGCSGSRSAATWTASRRLPIPPAPVSVTMRLVARRASTSATSEVRPTKGVACAGRLLGVRSCPRRASMRAEAVAGRRAGSTARPRRSAYSTRRARSPSMPVHAGRAPGRGGPPVRRAKAVAASEKTSAAGLGAWPAATSGAAYPAVPASAKRGKAASSADWRWEMPKSTSTAWASGVTITLAGLTSPWTTDGRWRWRWSRASATWLR